jgi:ABC transporter substrate binding protein
MGFDDDPVGNGFAASLARPGGNITGLSTLSPETSGKQLELLREIVSKLSRVAVVGGDVTRPGNPNVAADAFRVQVQYLEVRGPKDIEIAFGTASKERVDAVLVLTSAVLFSQRRQIADLAVKSRLPAIYARQEYVEDGGLMSMARVLPTCSGALLLMWTRFLKVQSRPISLSSNRPSSSSDQSESRQANRPDDSTECAGESE